MVFMVFAALASALLFGLAPALEATRANVMSSVRGEVTSDLRPVRVRNALVIAQITVCTLLLVACGALVRTTMTMGAFDIGFRTNNVIAIEVVENSRNRVMDALASDSAVDTIATASSIPLNGAVPSVTTRAENGPTISTAFNDVSPEYFEILGIPIVRGRNFTKQESASETAVAILSAMAAQRLFADRDALGQILHVSGEPARDVRVIGVAADIVTCCIPWGKDPALLYLPTTPATSANVLMHVLAEVESERHGLDTRLAALARGALGEIHSRDQYRAVGLYGFRAASMIGAVLGGLGLLTLTGIYGVVSCFVTQRTKEIGIRVALGATTHTVVGMVLKQSLRLTAIGTVVGTGLAIGMSRLLASRLVFMRVFDAAAFAAGVLLVASTALAAGYIPSRRAAQIDPIQTLRYD